MYLEIPVKTILTGNCYISHYRWLLIHLMDNRDQIPFNFNPRKNCTLSPNIRQTFQYSKLLI